MTNTAHITCSKRITVFNISDYDIIEDYTQVTIVFIYLAWADAV